MSEKLYRLRHPVLAFQFEGPEEIVLKKGDKKPPRNVENGVKWFRTTKVGNDIIFKPYAFATDGIWATGSFVLLNPGDWILPGPPGEGIPVEVLSHADFCSRYVEDLLPSIEAKGEVMDVILNFIEKTPGAKCEINRSLYPNHATSFRFIVPPAKLSRFHAPAFIMTDEMLSRASPVISREAIQEAIDNFKAAAGI